MIGVRSSKADEVLPVGSSARAPRSSRDYQVYEMIIRIWIDSDAVKVVPVQKAKVLSYYYYHWDAVLGWLQTQPGLRHMFACHMHTALKDVAVY
jgi:hypothetical protein